jgi:hypothetical protein
MKYGGNEDLLLLLIKLKDNGEGKYGHGSFSITIATDSKMLGIVLDSVDNKANYFCKSQA